MLKALIVDDEKSSRELLSLLLAECCTGVEVCGTAHNVKSAVAAIGRCRPNVVFLDVEMPGGNGFKFFQHFVQIDFDVVFTTAFNSYAVQAFEFAVTDYLLKPIDIDRLNKAIKRVLEKQGKKQEVTLPVGKLALPTETGYRVVDINGIARCSAERNYTVLYMDTGEKILVSKTLAKFEELLSGHGFLRTHRSHIVNLDMVHGFIKGKSPSLIMADGAHVDVSPARRKELFRRWGRL